MREYIIFSYFLINAKFDKRSIHLICDTGKYHSNAPLTCPLTKIPEVIDSCRIDERHLTHPYDTHLRAAGFLHAVKLFKPAGETEEERSVNLIYLDSCRDVETVCILH